MDDYSAIEIAGQMLMHDRAIAGVAWPPVTSECAWSEDEVREFARSRGLDAAPAICIRSYERQLALDLAHFEAHEND